jgi:hypothetical protein
MKRFILTLLTGSLFLASCAPAQKDSTPTQVFASTSTPSAGSESTVTVSASNAKTDSTNLSQTDSQGAVTVEVTPLNLDQPGDTLKFDVVMNTHMVDLSMDLATLTTLTTDTGLTLQPTAWDAPKGGHHVEGTLAFPATQSGKAILDGAKQLILTITGIDNVTRTFTWDLSAK